jgi:HEAT repeat protein
MIKVSRNDVLKDESAMVRFVSAYALGLIGDPRAVDALTYVASNDKHSLVREAAAEALEKIQAE